MDILIEFLGEILIEGAVELATNKKINKWIRYPILVLVIVFYSFIILGIGYLGIKILKDNILGGILLLGISLIILIGLIGALYRKLRQ